MNDLWIKTESQRCLGCKNPSCASGCPLKNDVKGFVDFVKKGELKKASFLFGNPFSAVCGYVCPAALQCVGGCVLNKKNAPIRFNVMEREICSDYPLELTRQSDELKGKKIAVVGGGVSGTAFAWFAYSHSADVVIYEKDELLSTLKLIPSFRLPKKAVKIVEDAVCAKIKVVKAFIDNEELQRISSRNDFVYVAAGRAKLYKMGVEGEELSTPYDEFLKRKNIRGRIAVVGGGNTALDCARLAKCLGAEPVIVYRRSEKDMPALKSEIIDAKREGVEFLFNRAPIKLEKNATSLKLAVAETLSEGRGRLTVTERISEICCDEAVAAVGSGVDRSVFPFDLSFDDNGFVCGNVYVGGDFAGKNYVVEAVADAKKAFADIMNKR